MQRIKKLIQLKQLKMVAFVAVCGLFVSCPNQHPGSIVILESMAMTRQNQCTIQSGTSGQFVRPFGVLDLAVTNHYYMFPHIYNNMPSSMAINGTSEVNLDVENNYLNITGADVRLDIPGSIYNDSNVDQTKLYSAMVDGFFVPAAGGLEPDTDVMTAVEIIPESIGNELRKVFKARINADACSAPSAEVYAYVKMEGVTSSGHKVSSNTFMFPVKLCWGCLVRYITNDPLSMSPQSNAIPCMPGQDDALSNVLCIHASMDKNVCYPNKACATSKDQM